MDHGTIFVQKGKVVHPSRKIEGNNPKKIIKEACIGNLS